ncbi:MucR family transcriptional regulator [Sphingomonas bisphenolicum]|uniref:MucR family transcriptional regulator n=1 Tax=Sphingomonas bisphenolicum TaxID=296544 RepID=A0ABN5WFX0_9SPHN|nr:MucR family transcriptional regulator [Sphingomonas bisphenolicum]BBF68803.1 MucR family transcriptional regulator [Sphingomonas bisphenolicum]
MSTEAISQDTLIALTADIVAAHVSNNSVSVGDVAGLIANVHAALSGLGTPAEPEAPKQEPAVSIRASVKPDYIVCLEDGKKLKMLKRHLKTAYQMTPDEYRAKWGLAADYPMTAPNYAQQRKDLAVKIGLGRKPKAASAIPAEQTGKAPAPRGRKPKPKVEAEPA